MSTKRQLTSFKILDAASMAGSLTSAVTNIERLDNIGIQVDLSGLSGTVAGSLNVQVSANYAQDNMSPANVTNTGTWVTMLTRVIAAGQPVTTYFDITQISAPWMRLVYTRSSGSGSMTAIITAKAL